MLTLVLADAELERVPAALTGHAQVVAAAQRFGVKSNRMLLDSSLHYAAMRKLEDGGRRGRPDLVHVFLLTALESLLNKAGHLRLVVHTREGYRIRVEPRTRLVRNYNRFCGLLEQLFETGRVPPEPAPALLTLEPGWSLKAIVEREKPDRVLVMDETAPARAPWTVYDEADAGRHVLAIVGGFPSGTFRSELPPAETVGFGNTPLSVWTVAAELIVHYERAMNLDLTALAAPAAIADDAAAAPQARAPRRPQERRAPQGSESPTAGS